LRLSLNFYFSFVRHGDYVLPVLGEPFAHTELEALYGFVAVACLPVTVRQKVERRDFGVGRLKCNREKVGYSYLSCAKNCAVGENVRGHSFGIFPAGAQLCGSALR
jgi:hypothetical protein